MRGCIRRPVGNGDALDAHDVRQPKIETATVATTFLVAPLAVTELTEDPIIVVDQEARALAPRGCLPDLLLHSGQPRAGGGVDQNDAPGGNLHDHEDVHDREQGGVLRQEVDREDLVRVVLDERPRGLTASRLPSSDHVAPNRAG